MQENPANWTIRQTLTKDTPTNRQVGNDQTPQIVLFAGLSLTRVCRIFLSAGFSFVFVGLSCLSDWRLSECPKKVRQNTKT